MRDALLQSLAHVIFFLGTLAAYVRHPLLVSQFVCRLGFLPHVCDPKTKHEKLLWRKIVDRNPLFPLLADKVAVRTFVAARCPSLQLTEMLWVGDSAAALPPELIHPGVVVKTSNASGRNIVVRDGVPDFEAIRARIAGWMIKPYGTRNGEWPYGSIPPRVLIERRVEAREGGELVDLSCHVAGGCCLLVNVDRDAKQSSETVGFFDSTGLPVAARVREGTRRDPYPGLPADYRPPATLPRAVEHALQLAVESEYVRVDFMTDGDSLYFCECTLFPIGGYSVISGGFDDLIASAWDLRTSWFMTSPQSGLFGLYAWANRRFGHDARRARSTGP